MVLLWRIGRRRGQCLDVLRSEGTCDRIAVKFRLPYPRIHSSLLQGTARAYSSSAGALASEVAFVEPDRNKLIRKLNLRSFSEEEIYAAYGLMESKKCGKEVFRLATRLDIIQEDVHGDPASMPPYGEFERKIHSLGEQLDVRVWPVAISFAATGLSIGIIIPILPLLVQEINLPSSIFGVAVSSFGLAKLIGNVPTAKWVDDYGRKPVMVGGMVVCAAGLGSVGFSLDPTLGAPWLIGCRFITGFGVAAFTSGAFMYMSDISTSLNRTRTMAPVMSGFQAGTAVGPAIGGVAVEYLGITNSYIAVGASIAALAVVNQFYLTESRYVPPPSADSTRDIDDRSPIDAGAAATAMASKSATTQAPSSSKGSFDHAMVEWRRLLQGNRKIGEVVVLNGCYWIALAGTQMTLLPLYMVADPLSLTPAQIGASFAAISVVSVAAAQPAAYLADKYGKIPCMIAGSGLLSLSMTLIPQTTQFEYLLLALTPLALGSTVLSSVPAAHMQDLCASEDRAQALALLRTAGDVGLLCGSISSGLISEYIGMSTTMGINAGFLAAALTWFGIRNNLHTSATGPSSSPSVGSGGDASTEILKEDKRKDV